MFVDTAVDTGGRGDSGVTDQQHRLRRLEKLPEMSHSTGNMEEPRDGGNQLVFTSNTHMNN